MASYIFGISKLQKMSNRWARLGNLILEHEFKNTAIAYNHYMLQHTELK